MEYMSNEIDQIATALSKAQAMYDIVIKGDLVKMKVYSKKTNKYIDMSYKFATLSTIQEAIKKPMADNELSYTHQLIGDKLVCRLMHSSGQWLASSYQLRFTDQGNIDQEMGKIITYGRRYTLAAIAGIAQEDDDASSQHGEGVSTTINGNPVNNAKVARSAPKPVKTDQPEMTPREWVDGQKALIKHMSIADVESYVTRKQKPLEKLYNSDSSLQAEIIQALNDRKSVLQEAV